MLFYWFKNSSMDKKTHLYKHLIKKGRGECGGEGREGKRKGRVSERGSRKEWGRGKCLQHPGETGAKRLPWSLLYHLKISFWLSFYFNFFWLRYNSLISLMQKSVLCTVQCTSLQIFIFVGSMWPLPRSRFILCSSPRKVPPARPRQRDHYKIRERKSLF